MPLFATHVITTFYHVDENAAQARQLGSLMDDALRQFTENWGLVEITVSQPYTRSVSSIIEDNMDHIDRREEAIVRARIARSEGTHE